MTENTAPQSTLPPEVVAAFDSAQRTAIALLGDVAGQLREGFTEAEVARLALQGAADRGFTGWFHKPHVRFGGPAVRGLLGDNSKRRLAVRDIVEIDFAPANAEAFADVGAALAFGVSEEPDAVRNARDLCRSACGFASRWKCTGEVFVYAQAWATNRGTTLGAERSVGHVCMTPTEVGALPWPQAARLAILARRHQVQWFNPRRMQGIYAIQPRLVTGNHGCAFEEMILVDGDTRRVLGRDSLEEVGTY